MGSISGAVVLASTVILNKIYSIGLVVVSLKISLNIVFELQRNLDSKLG